MTCVRLTVASFALLLAVENASAWSQAGHFVVGSVAFRRLPPEVRQRFVEVLRRHPRFLEDFEHRLPDDVAREGDAARHEWLLQQASVWPDIVRGFEGESLKRYHRGPWHYVNFPLYLTEADRTAFEGRPVDPPLVPPSDPTPEMNVVQTIRLARRMLRDPMVPDADKAAMLCWLCHAVGDLHQPEHSTSLYSRRLFPKGDRGGNEVPTRQRGNLHALWDDFLGGTIRSRTARNRAIALLDEPGSKELGERAARELDEATWLDESRAAARDFVYDAEVLGHLRRFESAGVDVALEPLALSESYLTTGGGVARRRVAQAGHRLAAVLAEVLGPSKP